MRGGIIGCGYFAQFHLEAWRRLPDAEIVAAADPDLIRAREAAPHAYALAEEMFDREQLDFADIAARPETHLSVVRLAAERRVPVICQKPMASTWSDAVAMVEAAAATSTPFMIHENWRWQPWYRVVHARLAQGDIGRPVSYALRTRKADGAGPEPYSHQPYFRQMPRMLIHETLVHHIDTARFLFGDVVSVFAQIRRVNPVIAGEDRALLILGHRPELIGVIDGHRFQGPIPDGPAMGEALFEGESGTLWISPAGDVFRNGYKIWVNDIEQGYKGDSVYSTQRHFLTHLMEGRTFETSGSEYLKTFAVVEAAYQSAEERRMVQLAST
jgi:D-apiose dehydrogenase